MLFKLTLNIVCDLEVKWEEIKDVAVMKTDKNTVIALMSFLLLAKNSSVKAVRRNISQYPVCINDEVKQPTAHFIKFEA